MAIPGSPSLQGRAKKIFLQCEFQTNVLENLSRQKQYDFSYENSDFVNSAACGLEFGV